MRAEYDKTNKVKYITKTTKFKDETGEQEIQETEVFKKYYGTEQFWKLFLSDFLNAMGLISNSKQLDVILHIMKNVEPSNNLFIGTYESIIKATGISYQTVALTFKKMLEVGLIEKQQNGVYRLSAKVMMKGSQAKKHRLIVDYERVEEE